MSKEFPYKTTLGQITRGGTWDFDSPYNPTEFAHINGWDSPDNWTPSQIKQFEAGTVIIAVQCMARLLQTILNLDYNLQVLTPRRA